jgi:hypothetical protein
MYLCFCPWQTYEWGRANSSSSRKPRGLAGGSDLGTQVVRSFYIIPNDRVLYLLFAERLEGILGQLTAASSIIPLPVASRLAVLYAPSGFR